MLMTSADSMVAGDNVLAVELHQWGGFPISAFDLFFGIRLRAIAPDPLAITRQPQNATNFVGGSNTFSVVNIVGVMVKNRNIRPKRPTTQV